MRDESTALKDPGPGFLALYDDSLPHVYGYLLSRCGQPALAEELTSQTFLGAVQAVRRDARATLSRAWLMAVARNKLVDHWRRQGREERGLRQVAGLELGYVDPWDAEIDAVRARETLDLLGPHHRMVLTLRYLDDLPVPEVAAQIDRTVHATEALLVRARAAFRRAYGSETPTPPRKGPAMPDAFEALRAEYRLAPYPPTDPDPGFAARLRARLEQALTLPEGVDVTVTTLETELVPEAAASDAAHSCPAWPSPRTWRWPARPGPSTGTPTPSAPAGGWSRS